MRYVIILFLMSTVLSGCDWPCICSNTGPEPFAAYIYTEEGDNYLDEHTNDSIYYYYIKDGGKIFSDITIGTFQDSTILNVINNWNIGADVKDFYFQVGSDVDTFFIEMKKDKYKKVFFNGAPVEWRRNPGLHFYIVKKKE